MSAPRKRRRFTWHIEVTFDPDTRRHYPYSERLRYRIKGPATPAGAVSKAMTGLAAARREKVKSVSVIGREPIE